MNFDGITPAQVLELAQTGARADLLDFCQWNVGDNLVKWTGGIGLRASPQELRAVLDQIPTPLLRAIVREAAEN